MIKRIACQASIKPSSSSPDYSDQIFSLFNNARLFNREHDIVGVFLVNGNQLLQVIEGEQHQLAKAVYNIHRDPRLHDVSIIMNRGFDTPYFTHWSIRIIKSENEANASYLRSIKRLLLPYCTFTSGRERERFERLVNENATPLAGENITLDKEPENFHGLTLGMKRWPKPNRLRLNAPLMRLCQILVGHNVPYQRLRHLNIFGSDSELDKHLLTLYRSQALDVSEAVETRGTVESLDERRNAADPKGDETKPNRFSQALRQFIHTQKAKGLS